MTHIDKLGLQNKFPWRRSIGKEVRFENMFLSVEGECDPDRIWLLLSDTSRFNRALGFAPRDEQEVGGQLVVTEKILGLKQISVEAPWDWVKGEYFVIHRKYQKGLALAAKVIIYIERLQNSRRVRVYMQYSFLSRNFISSFILKIGLKRLRPKVTDLLSKLIAQEKNFNPEKLEYPKIYKRNEGVAWPKGVEAILFEYRMLFVQRNIALEIIKNLFDLIQFGDEFELGRIKPMVLSKQWGIPLDPILEALIYGVKIGMFQMRWAAICPHCRGPRQEVTRLNEMLSQFNCVACDVRFTASDENSIEVYFSPSANFRKLDKVFYCVSEPAKKGHILVQYGVSARGSKNFSVKLKENFAYRARIQGTVHDEVLLRVAEDNYPELKFNGRKIENVGRFQREETLKFTNDSDDFVLLVIEEMWWGNSILPPGYVLLNPTFKEMFHDEEIPTGVQINLGGKSIVAITEQNNDKKNESVNLTTFLRVAEEYTSKKYGKIVNHASSTFFVLFESPFECSDFLTYMISNESLFEKIPNLKIAVDHGFLYADKGSQPLGFHGGPVKNVIKLCLVAEGATLFLSEDFYELVRGSTEGIGRNSEPVLLQWDGDQKKLFYKKNFQR